MKQGYGERTLSGKATAPATATSLEETFGGHNYNFVVRPFFA